MSFAAADTRLSIVCRMFMCFNHVCIIVCYKHMMCNLLHVKYCYQELAINIIIQIYNYVLLYFVFCFHVCFLTRWKNGVSDMLLELFYKTCIVHTLSPLLVTDNTLCCGWRLGRSSHTCVLTNYISTRYIHKHTSIQLHAL